MLAACSVLPRRSVCRQAIAAAGEGVCTSSRQLSQAQFIESVAVGEFYEIVLLLRQ